MKNIASLFSKTALLLPALAVTMLVSAQRGDRGGMGRGGGGFSRPDRGGGSQAGRSFGQPGGGSQPHRSFDQPRGGYQPGGNNAPGSIGSSRPGNDNRPVFNNRNDQPVATRPQQNTSRYFDGQRGDNGRQRDNVYVNRTPDQRDRVYSNNNRTVYSNNNINRSYGYNNRGYNNYGGYRGGNYGRPYAAPYRYAYHYPYYGQRYTTLNFHYNVIPFGGIGYCYNNGIFYRPFGGYFQVVAPPIGISISILPFGYTRVVYAGSYPYYYYGGTYYRQYNNYYEVVDPPLGAKLPALPQGAEETFINGQRYFEYNGTYYMEEYNINNQRLYTVVGVHGVLDDATVDRVLHGTAYQYDNSQPSNRVVYSSLPDNCTRVTINGQDYYKSPDDVYYEEITDGNNVSYQVVSSN